MDKLKLIFAERLKSARIMAGLSMEGLAAKLEGAISKQAIGKYESGKMLPSSDILIKLANTLAINPNYFFEQSSVKLVDSAFRKKSKLGQKIQDSIIAQASDRLEKYLEIEKLLGIENTFNKPKSLQIAEESAAESFSDMLRNEWKLGNAPISNLVSLLENRGIKVLELETVEEFDGFSAKDDNYHLIVVNSSVNIIRKRFTIAHELAHLILDMKEELSERQKEKICHRFAGSFLLPANPIFNELGKYRKNIALSELVTLKETFGISIQAILFRLKDLGIINESVFQQKNRLMRMNGWHKNEPGQFCANESFSRFQKLIDHATAENMISFSKAAYLSGKSIDSYRKDCKIL